MGDMIVPKKLENVHITVIWNEAVIANSEYSIQLKHFGKCCGAESFAGASGSWPGGKLRCTSGSDQTKQIKLF
jgi:hypothetical protein